MNEKEKKTTELAFGTSEKTLFLTPQIIQQSRVAAASREHVPRAVDVDDRGGRVRCLAGCTVSAAPLLRGVGRWMHGCLMRKRAPELVVGKDVKIVVGKDVKIDTRGGRKEEEEEQKTLPRCSLHGRVPTLRRRHRAHRSRAGEPSAVAALAPGAEE